MPRGNKTAPSKIAAMEKQSEALKLRKAGWTYDAIAQKVGYAAASGAEKAVKAALHKMLHDDAKDVLQLELTRLDDMLKGLYHMAEIGNPAAVDRVLRIMERRANYLGIDAPTKTYNFNVEIVSQAWDAIEAAGVDPVEAFNRIIAKAHADADSG